MNRSLHWLIGLLLGLAGGVTSAQSLRDPTLPPFDAGVAGVPGAAASPSFDSNATTVIVRNGRPSLAVGTRLYAQGEKLGQARIERITETELWLREGGALRKIPLFDGIERRTASAPALSAGCAPVASTRQPRVHPRKAAKRSEAAKVSRSGKVPHPSASQNTSPAVAPCVGVRP